MQERLTPAMKQYMDIKNRHPDCLVLFRMGDFYETFFEDAKIASRELEITLTGRGSKNGPRVPLAGIPYHALDNYLAKLIRKGIKVAIVEQMEDPKKAKGVVKRDVVRIVTPGTVTESQILDDRSNNYIASLYRGKGFGIAYVDLTTGEFRSTETDEPIDELARLAPAEILVPSMDEDDDTARALRKRGYFVNPLEDRHFVHEQATRTLTEHFRTGSLDGFGLRDRPLAVSSAGALLNYLSQTQKNSLGHINKISFYKEADYMLIDGTTVSNLELVKNIRNRTRENTLLSTIDSTRTSMGSRMLKRWLLLPLTSKESINLRLAAVDELCSGSMMRQDLGDCLSRTGDVERLISRVNLMTAGPRDLVVLGDSLAELPNLKASLAGAGSRILQKFSDLDVQEEAEKLIRRSMRDEPPVNIRDGGVIRKGYSPELDELQGIVRDSKGIIRDMESRERKSTGIPNLRIGFNRVFGYYFEITKKSMGKVPSHYVRKQTTANGERFVTEELKELEEKILGAEERIVAMESELFMEVLKRLSKSTGGIQKAAGTVAELDCLVALAETAVKNSYCRPEIADGKDISLRGLRHPVIEQAVDDYIPNDVLFSDRSRLMIITGPNMAGKSTLMRAASLAVILGQMGSFVPAESARLGISDRIFSRVGAHDDITHGQSTFMVEMNEVAQILNNASERSFVIMDEIGRGTSTYDGVAIAWAVAEHICREVKCNSMFATHYHALTKLSSHRGVRNYNIAVREDREDIVFLRKLVEGGTDKSYGIHVARLAGMPKGVIEKAREIQFRLEDEDRIKDRVVVDKKTDGDAVELRKSSQTSLLDL